MRLIWTAPAVAHLEAIRDFVGAESSPYYAERFVRRLVLAPERLGTFPLSGRVVPEGDGRHREIIEPPYRIVYRVEGDRVLIIAVVHGSRAMPAPWRAAADPAK